MFIVGLTGGIGSGKTTVANLFAQKDIVIIDTDLISRQLTQTGTPALLAIYDYFGEEVIHPDGSFNRTALRKIIFTDSEKKRWLEHLLHPAIRNEMNQQALQATSPYCIAVIPLLMETEKNPIINRILVVDTTEEIQLTRAQVRDQSSKESIQAILDTQINRDERLKLADDIIHNSGSIAELIPQVDQLHKNYLLLAKP
jgi:dephospho-CoA kinase